MSDKSAFSEEVISLKNVQKHLLNRKVLDIDTLSIYMGECVVVHGTNGAGKSTLLKILAGLVVPDSGTFSINGNEMNWRQAYRKFRKSVVYLHQTPYLFDRTVAENVAYGLILRKVNRSSIDREVQSALKWAGLSDLAHRNARDLSGGEKQRVALTRARILAPKLLLLDEPTTAMDQASKEQTFALIRKLADDGNTVYIATHESATFYQSDRVINMVDGQITNHESG